MRLGQVRGTKFGTNVSSKMLLNATKYQAYSFYCFWVIKGKPTGSIKVPPTPIRVNFDETYIEEVGRRFWERIIDYAGCDDKSHLSEHAEKTADENVKIDHFEILSNGYKNNKFKRKLAKALHIKHEKPTMNVQKQSVLLKLLNWQGPES